MNKKHKSEPRVKTETKNQDSGSTKKSRFKQKSKTSNKTQYLSNQSQDLHKIHIQETRLEPRAETETKQELLEPKKTKSSPDSTAKRKSKSQKPKPPDKSQKLKQEFRQKTNRQDHELQKVV